MNILVTGSNGFIGKNLKIFLLEKKFNVFEFKRGDSFTKLEKLIEKSDIIFHLAGENRPNKKILFKTNNIDLTNKICKIIEKKNKKIKVIFTSTIRINQRNSYSKSKLRCEKILIQLKKKINNNIKILRLPNVYGKWSKPNYNSVVSTFCYNIARNLKIRVFNDNEYIQLYYIDDLMEKFYELTKDNDKKIFTKIGKVDRIKVKDIANKIKDFHLNINNVQLNNLSPRVFKNLYSTYISFLPPKNFMFEINSYNDNRGEFIEFTKSENSGQVSCFTINPNKNRGGHYHHSKVEQFMILKGFAKIKYLNLYNKKIIIKNVNEKNLKIFRSMPGYVHTIYNVGSSKIIGIVWANEKFDLNKPDTFSYHD